MKKGIINIFCLDTDTQILENMNVIVKKRVSVNISETKEFK